MIENTPVPPPISPRRQIRAPLTYAQESLWFLQQLDPGNNAYNSNYHIRLSGGVDHVSMEKALNEMVCRHVPLRTFYPNQGGKPVQIVQEFEPFILPFVDFSSLTEEQRQKAVHQYLNEQGDQPFDLQRGPLIRYALLHLSPTEDILFFSTHHINSDAWSRQVFSSQLLKIYESIRLKEKPVLPDLPIQFADYATWQREWLSGEVLKTYVDHWKAILSGNLPILDLPTDKSRPVIQSFQGIRYKFPLPPHLTFQIRNFCQKERITIFHFFLAAYSLLLMRYSGQEDIIMGCPFANRSQSELENLVGLFVNTLPIRINLASNPTAKQLLGQVREIMLDAFTWQAVPFEAVVSEISPERDLSRTPVFQVAINLRNVPKQNLTSTQGLKAVNFLRDDAPAPFDLSLEFDEDDGAIMASLHYNADLFNEKTIILMAAHYQNLLGEILSKPESPISELEMLTPSEKRKVLYEWNETKADFPQVCVHELITEQVEKTPNAVALVCNDLTLTYGELEQKANQLANYLREKSDSEGSRVGIFLPRSLDSVISILAILKAGGSYIALDLTHPVGRTAEIVKDSEPAVIITLSTLRPQLPDQIQTLCLDTESLLINATSSNKPKINTSIYSPAYVIYTSGSTGQPKGVVNLHIGVVNYLLHMKREFHLTSSDRIVHFTSHTFDLSVFEILGTLSYGGTIQIIDDIQMRDPDCINSAVIDYQATFISMVPTMLRALCESVLSHKEQKHNLRWILSAGEVLFKSDVELARKAYGSSVQIANLYGPSECSIVHTTYIVPEKLPGGQEGIPIGRPVSNTRSYVLDKYFHPVPVGTKGELFISGVGVGQGYWNQPSLTAERFLLDPFFEDGKMYRTGDIVRQLPEGTLCYQGRLDNQVKIRGYRVELGEIEAVMARFPGVKNAAVKIFQKANSSPMVAYISTLSQNHEKLKLEIRKYIADLLPFYMIPNTIVVLDDIPLTPSGKIDRMALQAPEKEHKHYLAPRNEIEKRLVEIWENVLEIKNIGVRDNFFELGGHSLLAVRLFTMIQMEFDRSIPLLLLFKEGTIESLANYLLGTENTPALSGVVPIKESGNGTPLFILPAGLHMGDLALKLGEKHPIYALYPFENGKQVFRGSIQETAKIYFQCLTEFDPNGPYLLIGHSADGLFALELARLLRQEGKKVEFLGLIDTYPPGFYTRVNMRERIRPHLRRIGEDNLLGVLKYVFRSVKRETLRLLHAGEDLVSIKKHEKSGAEIQGRRILLRTYKPEPYDGDVVLFSVTSRPDRIHKNPMEPWSKVFLGNVEMITVEGDHMSILQPPQVNGLAEKILTTLDRNESKL
jgi:amino acid adenylation domain-containing protein